MSDRDVMRVAWAAGACAATMIAWHVAARATRDALFLTEFGITDLPTMVIVSALFSIALVPAMSHGLARFTPARFVPALFCTSSVLLLGLWALYRVSPGAAAVLMYLHIAGVGALLISGFWSVANEVFDPRTGKKALSTIGWAASAGGLVGGLLASQMAVHLPVDRIFPVLAGLHLLCAATILYVGKATASRAHAPRPASSSSGYELLTKRPYLRQLAALALLGSLATALLDYVFKAEATKAYQSAELMQFFAAFYTITGLATVLLQASGTRRLIQFFGLGRALATVPAVLGLGGVGALLAPGLVGAVALRGANEVLGNSVFRTGYELLYIPIDARDKRRAKPIIDIGMQRLGDAAGGLVVLGVLAVGLSTQHILLAGFLVLCGALLWVCLRVEQGYVDALAQSLVSQAPSDDLFDGITDGATQRILLGALGTDTLTELDPALSQVLFAGVLPASGAMRRPQGQGSATAAPAAIDPVAARVAELHSPDLARVRAALAAPLGRVEAASVVGLLVQDEVAAHAIRALGQCRAPIVGLLVDALCSTDEPFAVRRRIPLALAEQGGQRAVDGLLSGLHDRRFEVRFRCGRALTALVKADASLVIRREPIEATVLREAAVGRIVWDGRRHPDSSGGDTSVPAVNVGVPGRSNRSMEHVFTLMALVLDAEPLRMAYQALLTQDRALEGTALEYLEQVLPSPIRDALWPFLDDEEHPHDLGQPSDALDKLLRSHMSIRLHMERLHGGPGGE